MSAQQPLTVALSASASSAAPTYLTFDDAESRLTESLHLAEARPPRPPQDPSKTSANARTKRSSLSNLGLGKMFGRTKTTPKSGHDPRGRSEDKTSTSPGPPYRSLSLCSASLLGCNEGIRRKRFSDTANMYTNDPGTYSVVIQSDGEAGNRQTTQDTLLAIVDDGLRSITFSRVSLVEAHQKALAVLGDMRAAASASGEADQDDPLRASSAPQAAAPEGEGEGEEALLSYAQATARSLEVCFQPGAGVRMDEAWLRRNAGRLFPAWTEGTDVAKQSSVAVYVL